jgi:fumarylacetoacetase
MTGFGPGNLPYGVDGDGHTVVAWGREVIDLARLPGLDVGPEVFSTGSLNPFMGLGPEAWALTRDQLRLRVPSAPPEARRPRSEVQLVRPWDVGDYVDFYASREHATNMGRMLRPGEEPLPPAWLHVPLAYHGHPGSVIVSGEPVYRPSGVLGGDDVPRYAPTERLDLEVELGFVVGVPVERGRTLTAAEAERHIFGVVLVNDWSARDIQAFEYRPLGPFLSKSFATSVSPWVVPLPALDRWRAEGPRQDPEPVPYLKTAEPRNFDIRLRLSVNGTVLSNISSAGLYWSPAQQLAHLTANGAGVGVGDLFATGTISGGRPRSEGSLMELGGASMWLADGDVVTIVGWCGDRTGEEWISLGEVTAEVRP